MAHGPQPEVRRGTVGDRPWGVTLGSFARSQCTGQLTLTADGGKPYCVAFVGGAVVGATSPLASDAVARVALKSHLVSSTQVPALARAVAAAPARDEVELLAELARLTPDQADLLRRRLLVQRAARTFAVERGAYVFDEQITVSSAPGVEVDLAPAIWLGVRMNLSQDRLAEDLRRLGSRFVLRAEEEALARLELTDGDRRIVQALRIGTSLPELEAKHRDLEPRAAQATIYALVATGLCEGHGAPVQARVLTGTADDEDGELARAKTLTFERGPALPVEPARARTISSAPPLEPGLARVAAEAPRTRTISSAPPLLPRQGNVSAVREIIAAGTARLDVRADHFALLGVRRDASLDTIRSAYVALACYLHPDKLPELDPAATRDAQRLFAHINIAYGVLADPARRADYLASLQGGGMRVRSPTGPLPATTSVERAGAAAEVAQQGLRALRREDLPAAIALLARATELAPHDVDHAAALGWARFCASPDKPGIAADVRRVLERAIQRSPRPVTARFYLGRVERMLGRVREAMHHFREVIALEPGHAEAAAELRLLEPRAARK